jgi:5-methylcytosine-specific restriction endonuclease McrA
MPCDYKKYPKDWKRIVMDRRKEANNKCELCYAPNRAYVDRPINESDRIHWAHPWYLCNTEGSKSTKIVLTLHHIDCNKQNNTRQNLILLCQKCHCRLDTGLHIEHAKETRNRKKGLQSFL